MHGMGGSSAGTPNTYAPLRSHTLRLPHRPSVGAELYVFQLHSTTSMPWYMQDVVDMGAREAERLRQRLAAALELGQLAPARNAAELLDKPGAWRRVGAAAVAALDAATAARQASVIESAAVSICYPIFYGCLHRMHVACAECSLL